VVEALKQIGVAIVAAILSGVIVAVAFVSAERPQRACDQCPPAPVDRQPYQPPQPQPSLQLRRQPDGWYWLFDGPRCLGKYDWRSKTYYRWYDHTQTWSTRPEQLPAGVPEPIGAVGDVK
jgi:hypothetical protein